MSYSRKSMSTMNYIKIKFVRLMCTLISAQKQARDIYAQSQDCSPMFSHLYKNHFDDACSGLSFLSPTDTNETSQKDL